MHSLKKSVKPEILNRYDLWVLRHRPQYISAQKISTLFDALDEREIARSFSDARAFMAVLVVSDVRERIRDFRITFALYVKKIFLS
jgi:hypothetical protein